MLEADEVDDDYFTPVSNTPLANIFSASGSKASTSDSLKYTPPKKPVPIVTGDPKPEEDSKSQECVFVSALMAYEWSDNNYAAKGKVGFAVMKNLKGNSHSIILYDSNKTILSSALISQKLNIIIKGNNYICYYDNFSKYWSIYAKDEEIKAITETLQNLGVELKHAINTDENPHTMLRLEHDHITAVQDLSEKESDTDSSLNRKTKASILNRMANMGHSVLPPTKQATDVSSDSSEAMEEDKKHSKAVKHKPKVLPKRPIPDVNKTEISIISDPSSTTVATREPPISTSTMYTFINGQLVPVNNSSIITSPSYSSNNEMNLFITEQRINNSELRINVNRTTDKLDLVLEKIKTLELFDKPNLSTNFQTEIMQKLIAEYENKIKVYEKILASNNIPTTLDIPLPSSTEEVDELENFRKKISMLESVVEKKDIEIATLKGNLEASNHLMNDIANLKQSLDKKNQETENTIKKFKEGLEQKDKESNKSLETTLKFTMNDVFQTITTNFQSDEKYSGEYIKSVIASVIRKVTIQSLNASSENYYLVLFKPNFIIPWCRF